MSSALVKSTLPPKQTPATTYTPLEPPIASTPHQTVSPQAIQRLPPLSIKVEPPRKLKLEKPQPRPPIEEIRPPETRRSSERTRRRPRALSPRMSGSHHEFSER